MSGLTGLPGRALAALGPGLAHAGPVAARWLTLAQWRPVAKLTCMVLGVLVGARGGYVCYRLANRQRWDWDRLRPAQRETAKTYMRVGGLMGGFLVNFVLFPLIVGPPPG